MKIAVILSGTVRQFWKSLTTLDAVWLAGHEVDIYARAWKNVARTQQESWSKAPSMEPTPEVMQYYRRVQAFHADDYEAVRPRFVEIYDRWLRDYKLQNATSLGAMAMFWSLCHAYNMVPQEKWREYDMFIRLRYDCLIYTDIIDSCQKCGVHVPCGVDFGGLNDQLAIFKCDRDKPDESWHHACGVFKVWDFLGDIMRGGAQFHPELWNKLSVERCGVPLHRTYVGYTIH